MRISVVIPTLGTRSTYLEEALQSIIEQTLLPNEIIVVNNGPHPIRLDMLSMATELPIKNLRTVYGAGVAQARNVGATFANGDVVAFLDDDDLWGEHYLEYSLMELVSSDSKCVLGRIDKLVDGVVTKFLNATGHLGTHSFMVMNPGATGSNVLIYKDTFLEVGGYDIALPPTEDGALIVSLLDLGIKVSVNSDAQALMRIHSNERLTNPRSAAIGFKAFYLKYRGRLEIRDRIYLIWKYRREEFKATRSLITLLWFGFYSFLIIVCNRRPRTYWTHPEANSGEKSK